MTDHTPLVSPDASGMFGATYSSPEVNTTIFGDAFPDGTVHLVTWQTATPVTLGSLGASSVYDAYGKPTPGHDPGLQESDFSPRREMLNSAAVAA